MTRTRRSGRTPDVPSRVPPSPPRDVYGTMMDVCAGPTAWTNWCASLTGSRRRRPSAPRRGRRSGATSDRTDRRVDRAAAATERTDRRRVDRVRARTGGRRAGDDRSGEGRRRHRGPVPSHYGPPPPGGARVRDRVGVPLRPRPAVRRTRIVRPHRPPRDRRSRGPVACCDGNEQRWRWPCAPDAEAALRSTRPVNRW